ncbi:hypothetical protein VOLCADRAFT_108633 [Volvox carteri f. nagariensis]|uniref:Uncharacterized protein n=1 Tax=Volvox carteri f. nagariensis TaxID=3068 RepID=D8ULG3_VOLCA|nr:uncharacterized protein VOLCADRAFT_108633 [Volvox carteri f. nagariensis]EFJ39435.1 hypothetical protein VOLCADRAFT_108633 [Volvox carteri f. nagariensis]|eukprot:XP_002959499.1 hypothetical protein VOLCADRAFT_108633 [Volvox carteri f. nagariensis]
MEQMYENARHGGNLVWVAAAGQEVEDAVEHVVEDPPRVTQNFVSQALVNVLGLFVRPAAFLRVLLTDGGSAPILGQAVLRLKLGPIRINLPAIVLSALASAADVIVGIDSLERYGADMNLGKNTLTI